jgi:hypothetical protein
MKLSTSNVGSLRSNKRFLAVSVLAAICLMLTFFSMGPSLSTCHGTIRTVNSAQALSSDGSKQMTFANLNHLTATASARDNKEHVLILTPLKNAVPYLERYFELVDRLSYPKHLISLAFLVSDTTDSTVSELQRHARELQSRWQDRYHSIRIFEKDFKFELTEEERHKYELQPKRRSFMARSRNYLLTAALTEEISWVLWLDVDVVEYPSTILEDLQSVNEDVVVPNCLLQREDGAFWGYDKNNWQETPASLEIQKDLSEDFVLLEGKKLAKFCISPPFCVTPHLCGL